MKCPFCGYAESKVIDTRPADEGERIRRRRECLSCEKRFTTYEVVETTPLMVIKKDGSREVFSRDKLLRGMIKSCEKRPVSLSVLEDAVADIQLTLQNRLEREVPSSQIGELCMEKLKGIDQVAYVRFASVYRQFKDINSFLAELKNILQHEENGS
ncbi:transcriptional regulator NrdR [Angelakisella massiliensis]|uniref:transcriptional regulator NrdR n=1 Tax=Angelakisella massiliensis TaxID=1871018 RepID=UPI0008F8F044|nr:transcriptional regulator NrdR [Angelakisella massiliensis]